MMTRLLRWAIQDRSALKIASLLGLGLLLGTGTVAAGNVPSLEEARGTFTIQKSSRIAFSVGQVGGGGIKGEFQKFAGRFKIDSRDIGRSTIRFSLYPDSVTTGEPRVENFLRSSAVFDSSNFDKITFASTQIRQTGADTADIEGRLTAKGITRVEHFKVKLTHLDRSGISFDITGGVYRSRYKMDVGTPIYSNIVEFNLKISGRRI